MSSNRKCYVPYIYIFAYLHLTVADSKGHAYFNCEYILNGDDKAIYNSNQIRAICSFDWKEYFKIFLFDIKIKVVHILNVH